MSERLRMFCVAAVATVLLVLSGWLLTYDVYANTSDASTFCGSAYDVAFVKGDGYMGGEIPSNMAELNTLCTRTAARLATAGSCLLVASLFTGAYALAISRRQRQKHVEDAFV